MNSLNKKRKIIILLIAVMIIAAFIIVGLKLFVHPEMKGIGTKEEPYLISNIENLQQISRAINSGDTFEDDFFVLTDNIDLKGKDCVEMIGAGDNEFLGNIDGAGFSIRNINHISDGEYALFGNMGGAIYNLVLEDGTIENSDEKKDDEGGSYTAALALHVLPEGRVLNCLCTTSVFGKNAGTIAAVNEGTTINCVSFTDPEKKAEMRLFRVDEDSEVQNCYSSQKGYFELWNNASDEVNSKVLSTAVENLNTRLLQLSKEYPDYKFISWEGRDAQHPFLTGKEVDVAVSVISESGEEAEYDYVNHAFFLNEKNKGQVLTVITSSGKEEKIDSPREADEISLMLGNSYTDIVFGQNTLLEDVRNKAYFADGQFEIKEMYTILESGRYDFEDKQNIGQILVDIKNPEEDDAVEIVLSNVSIENKTGPGILIKTASESDVDSCGVKIILKDKSENTISGANCMNLFFRDEKFEGAVSSSVTYEFSGEGSLLVNGMLEGIESNSEIKFKGGKYHIICPDDGINASDKIAIEGGYYFLEAGDDLIDCNGPVIVEDGTIVGSTKTEHAINSKKHLYLDGGTLCAGSKDGCRYDEEALCGRIQIEYDEMSDDYFKEGSYIVMTDENDSPRLAYLFPMDVKIFDVSTPEMIGEQGYRFYLADKVEAEFVDGMAEEIKSFNSVKKIEHDDGDVFYSEEERYNIR